MMQAIGSIITNAERNNSVKDGDYCKDGLLYCGTCHTQKQCVISLFGEVRTVPCMCRCQQEAHEEMQRKEEQRRQRNRIDRIRREGVQDKQMLDWTFERDNGCNPEGMKKALKYYRHWSEMRQENIGLLFCGGVGTGKTYAAACIGNALLEDGVRVMMTNFSRIINELSKFGKIDANEYIDHLNSFDLLVLDDFGAERQTEYAQEIVFDVIDSRYKSEKPVIITTNLQINDIKNPKDVQYSRIYSRIMEMCTPILFRGDDLRSKAHASKKQKAKELFWDGVDD